MGYIAVDAGMVYIGDPCYVIGKPLGQSYEDFLRLLDDDHQHHWQIMFERYLATPDQAPPPLVRNPPVRAVVVTSGYGDGMYPVVADVDQDGRVRKVTIDFDR